MNMNPEKPKANNEPAFDKKFYENRFSLLKKELPENLTPAEPDADTSAAEEKYKLYKRQGDFIAAIMHDLERAVQDKIIADDNLKQKVEEFLKSKFSIFTGQPTKREEIDKIKAMLDEVIEHLEKN